MKKTSRELQRSFGSIVHTLKPGQALHVTEFGKHLCTVIKAPKAKVRRPNFAAAVAKDPYSPKTGQAVVAAICHEPLL